MKQKVKQCLKYPYYKALCKLLGDSHIYKGPSVKKNIARHMRGRSALLLQIEGEISGVGYSGWLKSYAKSNKVDCRVQKKNNKRAEALLIGNIGNIAVVAQAAWRGPEGAKINNIKERWLDKRDRSAAAVQPHQGKKFTITFGGDTSLGDYYVQMTKDKSLLDRLENNPLSFFAGVRPLTDGSDHFIVNLETVLADNPTTSLDGKEYPNWDSPERTVSVLKQLGVTAVSLSNNHALDFGPEVMQKTCEHLKDAGIEYFGAGDNTKEALLPLKLELRGEKSNKKVYIFNGMRASKRYWVDYSFAADETKPGVNPLDLNLLLPTIAELRQKEPDALLIVCPHWQGRDYKWVTSEIVDICRSLIVFGADYVFAHGTHTANHLEKTSRGTIAFSIGNFIFNSRGRYSKLNALPYSMLVRLQIEENNGGWKAEPHFYPIVTDNRKTGFNVRLADSKECYELYGKLIKKTDNANGFITIYEKSKDQHGYFFSVKNKEDVNLKRVIFKGGEVSKTALKDIRLVASHLDQLKKFHHQVDTGLVNYYKKLLKSGAIRSNEEMGNKIFEDTSRVIKKEYISHASIKKFERRKVDIKKAISFKEIMIEKSVAKQHLACPEYAWYLDKKDVAYKFADRIGLRRPVTALKVYKLSEIEEQDGPVVIKPVRATGARGVYLIFDKNTILSVWESVYLKDWSEFMERAQSDLDAGLEGKNSLRKDEWILEELILDPSGNLGPPNDLKFYMFYGEVCFVKEVKRAYLKQYCFWDADLNIIDTGKYKDKPIFKGSGFTEEDVETVTAVSLQIPSPFIRLDMFKDNKGLVFGEATPRPGQFHTFNDKYDRILGEAYRRGESRIIKDLLNGKKFAAFTSVFNV